MEMRLPLPKSGSEMEVRVGGPAGLKLGERTPSLTMVLPAFDWMVKVAAVSVVSALTVKSGWDRVRGAAMLGRVSSDRAQSEVLIISHHYGWLKCNISGGFCGFEESESLADVEGGGEQDHGCGEQAGVVGGDAGDFQHHP